jgi:hypothetical protein
MLTVAHSANFLKRFIGLSMMMRMKMMLTMLTQMRYSCFAGADPGFANGGAEYGERVEREPITGVWGRSPQRGPGAPPLVGVRGRSPLKLKSFGVFHIQTSD